MKLEVWPGGDQSRAYTVGEARIINDLTGTPQHGNYDVQLMHSGKYVQRQGVWRQGRVVRHLRKLSPYHLVQRALKEALYG
ncbi:MAG: hypothetical protein AAF609_05535 [Cyanobacteria bacterium P01_C01_bin.120]